MWPFALWCCLRIVFLPASARWLSWACCAPLRLASSFFRPRGPKPTTAGGRRRNPRRAFRGATCPPRRDKCTGRRCCTFQVALATRSPSHRQQAAVDPNQRPPTSTTAGRRAAERSQRHPTADATGRAIAMPRGRRRLQPPFDVDTRRPRQGHVVIYARTAAQATATPRPYPRPGMPPDSDIKGYVSAKRCNSERCGTAGEQHQAATRCPEPCPTAVQHEWVRFVGLRSRFDTSSATLAKCM